MATFCNGIRKKNNTGNKHTPQGLVLETLFKFD
jgi:hypothetical protein